VRSTNEAAESDAALPVNLSRPQPSASELAHPGDPLVALEQASVTRDEWLALAADASELGLWYWNEKTGELFWDHKIREIFGIDPNQEMTLDVFYDAIHPDDLVRVREVWRYEFVSGLPYELEYRALRKDGSVRWVTARGQGHYDDRGQPWYMVGVVLDTTERKEAETERLELTGRVLTAQEEERARIAREIHDDYCQRLALLTMKLGSVARAVGPGTEQEALVEELSEAIRELGRDIREMSHRLHPASLDLLSLYPCMDGLCRDMAKQYGLPITFKHEDLPDEIDADIKLAVYRIAQEALHNTAKHSGASSAEVRISGAGDVITLVVADDGRGFDSSNRSASAGIGIQSMRERARMMDGDVRIETRPAVAGTQVVAIIPLVQNPSGTGHTLDPVLTVSRRR
jgi:PAS domain S-box-containing protein